MLVTGFDVDEFIVIIAAQKDRIERFFPDHIDPCDAIEMQFIWMRTHYQRDPKFTAIIDAERADASYAEAWAPLSEFERHIDLLKVFAGGFASVFPGTSAVEGDTSVLKQEKHTRGMQLTNMNLQGIVHCKQIERLHSLFEPLTDQ